MTDGQENVKSAFGGKAGSSCLNSPRYPSVAEPYVSVLAFLLIAVIATFYALTIREGHEWGDDFALYVLHAKSIVEAKGYTETPYIHTDLYPDIGPRAYPPGLPILLSPVYKWFGFNINAMKIAVGVFFVAALWVLFVMYRLQLPWPYAVGLILLLGFNPVFWDHKDTIMSDFPFLFLTWATLYAVEWHYDNRERDKFSGSIFYAVLVGACMYFAYGLRVLGALLPVSLLLYELMKWKKLSRFSVTAVLVVSVLIAVQSWLLPDVGRGYVYQSLLKYNTVGDSMNRALETIVTYLKGLPSFFDNGYNKPIKIVLCAIISLFAAIGLRKRVKEGIAIQEVFLFLYLIALVIVPFPIHRYLFPIIPLYFFYACLGVIEIRSLVSGRGWQYAPIILTGAVALSYSSMYTTMGYGAMREGIGRKESQELFLYIREHTERGDVIIFRKPRALALLTGRRSSIYPEPARNPSDSDLIAWNYFQSIGARYLILAVPRHACCPHEVRDIEWLQKFVERNKSRWQEVFSNADFKMYELKRLIQDGTRPARFGDRS